MSVQAFMVGASFVTSLGGLCAAFLARRDLREFRATKDLAEHAYKAQKELGTAVTGKGHLTVEITRELDHANRLLGAGRLSEAEQVYVRVSELADQAVESKLEAVDDLRRNATWDALDGILRGWETARKDLGGEPLVGREQKPAGRDFEKLVEGVLRSLPSATLEVRVGGPDFVVDRMGGARLAVEAKVFSRRSSLELSAALEKLGDLKDEVGAERAILVVPDEPRVPAAVSRPDVHLVYFSDLPGALDT